MKRYVNCTVAIASLLTGGAIYVLFRENTHIARLFSSITLIEPFRIWLKETPSDVFRFYLPDFLWGLSLGCGLQAILKPTARKNLLCGGVAFLCGVIWECLQFSHIISGTGDILDIVLYLLACALCTFLNIKEREQ